MAWQSDAVVASNGEAILLRFLTPFGMTIRDEIAAVASRPCLAKSQNLDLPISGLTFSKNKI